MSASARALVVCQVAERRLAALAKQAEATAAAFERRSRAEAERVQRSRNALEHRPAWTCHACSAMTLRETRGAAIIDASLATASRARESRREHASQRLRWAQLRRGLERRLARQARKDRRWPD